MKKLALSLVVASLVAAWVPSTASGDAGLDGSFGPTRNLWIDRSTLVSLPTSGSAWNRLAEDATGSWGSADIADQESDHDVLTFAGALYAVSRNDVAMRNRVVNAIESAIGTEQGGRTLALGRNLTGYVLAADLVGYDSTHFRSWLSSVRSANLDGRTLITTNDERPNNWGTHAGSARIAADLFLADTADLEQAVRVFHGFLGDRSACGGIQVRGRRLAGRYVGARADQPSRCHEERHQRRRRNRRRHPALWLCRQFSSAQRELPVGEHAGHRNSSDTAPRSRLHRHLGTVRRRDLPGHAVPVRASRLPGRQRRHSGAVPYRRRPRHQHLGRGDRS